MEGWKWKIYYLLLGIFAFSTGFLLDSKPCSSELPVYYTRASNDPNHNIITQTLVLQSPNVVTKIGLNLSNCSDIYAAHPEAVKSVPNQLTFIEATNPLRTDTSFFKAGPNYDWKIGDTSSMLYLVVDPTYTRTVTLTTLPSLECAKLSLYGCPQITSVCSSSNCLHGVCVGNGFCSCDKGYVLNCYIPISRIAVGNFEITSVRDKNVLTKSGQFTKVGEVNFFYQNPSRRFYLNAHFHGIGGHLSLKHETYCTDTHGRTQCTHSRQSAFNYHHGFCHSNLIKFSVHHDHHHEIFFYNTNIHEGKPGSSLSYLDNQLNMSVNHGNQKCQVSAPWQPTSDHAHVIASSYSPQYGCSIYVDGHHKASAASHNDPTQSPALSDSFLCIGKCRINMNVVPIADYTIYGFKVVGASAPHLALNGILGLLRSGAIPNPTLLSTTQPSSTTTTTTTTTTKKTIPSTTTKSTKATQTTPTSTTSSSTSTTTTSATKKTTLSTTTKSTKATQTTTTSTTTTTKTTTTKPIVFTATKNHTATTANIPTGSLICYSCQDSSTDGACKAIVQCQAGEVCSVFKDNNGYSHNCLDKNVCNVAKSMTTSDCWICCSSTLCNKQCKPTVQCQDAPKCDILKSTGYDVCHDQALATTECMKTCGHCPSG